MFSLLQSIKLSVKVNTQFPLLPLHWLILDKLIEMITILQIWFFDSYKRYMTKYERKTTMLLKNGS